MKRFGHWILALCCLLAIQTAVAFAGDRTDTIPTQELREVVATGTRNRTDVRILPLTVSVLTDSVLTERQENNILPTLMEHVPGLFVTQRGVMGYGVSTGGSGGIKVRGIGGSPNTDVLVLIDGLPQYAGLYGHPVADNYQTMMAERVEVIRGPASVFYGSNAMGGVINIVTHQPMRDTVLTNLHVLGGSYGTVDAGITNQVRRGRFSSAAGFNYSRTDGHRGNMQFAQYSGFLKLGYDLSQHWRLNGSGNISYFDTHNPGTIEAPILESRLKILRGMAALSLENEYELAHFATSGAVRAYYNGGRHVINDGYKADASPVLPDWYLHTDFMAGVSAYQSVALFRGNRTTLGFDYQYFGGHAWNEAVNDGSHKDIIRKTQYELAAYLDFRQQVCAWFSLDAGIRLDWHNEAGLAYAPQGGVSFLLPHDAELKAQASRGFRNPTIRELYMYKPANADLKPVSLWNYELSYRQSLLDRRLRLGLNIFYLHAANNIETRMVDGRPLNVNTGEMHNAGCEAEIHWRIWKGLGVDANYSWLWMREPLLAAPEHKLNIAIGYHHQRFRAGTSVQYIHGLYTVLPTSSTPAVKQSFVLWNAHGGVRIWRELWATLKAENLLAQSYEINAGFPLPPTTVMAGLSFSF